MKLVNRVREKNETIHFCRSLMKTGASGEARAKPRSVHMATPSGSNEVNCCQH